MTGRFLALLAPSCVLLALLASTAREHRPARRAPEPALAAQSRVLARLCEPDQHSALDTSRRAASDGAKKVEIELPSSMREPERVLVRGRVHHHGRPWPDRAIAVYSGRDEVDWDFTDDDGFYEVRVPPGDYRLSIEGQAAAISVPASPAGGRGLTRDVFVP